MYSSKAFRGANSYRMYVRCTSMGHCGRNEVFLSRTVFTGGRQVRTMFSGGSSGSRHTGHGGWKKEWMDYVRRRLVIFRGDMIRKRPFNVPKPLQRFLTSQRITSHTLKEGAKKEAFTMSYSEITGHTAFLFSLCMFLETDIFNLRLFAIGSILSSVIFQYYREIPLLIPIRWNLLFVCINIGMLGLLLQEYHEAEYMPKEQKDIYMKYLAAEGMDKVDFMHLMSKAERKLVKPGEYLIRQGKMNYHVHYLADGNVTVLRDGDVVSKLGANTFVAEMGFVKWREFETQRQRKEEKEREGRRRKESLMGFQTLGNEVQRSLSYMGGSLSTPGVEEDHDHSQASGTTTTPPTEASGTKLQQIAVESKGGNAPAGASSGSGSGRTWRQWFEEIGVAQPSSPSSAALLSMEGADGDGCVTDAATGFRIDVKNQGIVASSDVKATKKCVVYSWRFHDLEELMSSRTGAALVLERSFSSDLSRKMRKHDLKQKYKYVLLGLTLTLSSKAAAKQGGQALDPATASAVRRLRKEYGVSQKIHREVCDDLGLPLSEFDLPGEDEDEEEEEEEEENEDEEDAEDKRSRGREGPSPPTDSKMQARQRQAQRQEGGRFTSLAQGKLSEDAEEGSRGSSGSNDDGDGSKGESQRVNR